MQQIGKDFAIAGAVLSLFGGTFAQVGAFLIAVGNDLQAGQGQAGPVRIGNEGVTVNVAPWATGA